MKTEGMKYVDMSVEQLEQEIVEETAFAERQGANQWQLEDLKRQEQEIERANQRIQEEKKEYEERVKIFKDRKREANRRIKFINKSIKIENDFRQTMFAKVDILKRIKENLEKKTLTSTRRCNKWKQKKNLKNI